MLKSIHKNNKKDLIIMNTYPTNPINILTPAETFQTHQLNNAFIAVEPINQNRAYSKEDRIKLAHKAGLKYLYTRPDLIRTSLYTLGAAFIVYGLATNDELKKNLTSIPETTKRFIEEQAKNTTKTTLHFFERACNLASYPKKSNILNPAALEFATATAKNLEPVFENGKKIATKLLIQAGKSLEKHKPENLSEIVGKTINRTMDATQAGLNFIQFAKTLTVKIIQTGIQSTATAIDLTKKNITLVGLCSVAAAKASEKAPKTVTSIANESAEIAAPKIVFLAKASARGAFNAGLLTGKAAVFTTKIITKATSTTIKAAFNTVKTTAQISAKTIKFGAKSAAYCLKKAARLAYKTEVALDAVKTVVCDVTPINSTETLPKADTPITAPSPIAKHDAEEDLK